MVLVNLSTYCPLYIASIVDAVRLSLQIFFEVQRLKLGSFYYFSELPLHCSGLNRAYFLGILSGCRRTSSQRTKSWKSVPVLATSRSRSSTRRNTLRQSRWILAWLRKLLREFRERTYSSHTHPHIQLSHEAAQPWAHSSSSHGHCLIPT